MELAILGLCSIAGLQISMAIIKPLRKAQAARYNRTNNGARVVRRATVRA